MIQESPPAHQPERAAVVRAQLARQDAATNCPSWMFRRWIPPTALGRAEHARGNRGVSRSQRSGSHPPFHAPLDAELRHRSGPVSAGLLHHEVQPARQRAGGAHRRPGLGASLSAGVALAGNPGSDGDARTGAGRNHRHGRGDAAAGRRRARRVHRHPAGSRAARIARAIRARSC